MAIGAEGRGDMALHTIAACQCRVAAVIGQIIEIVTAWPDRISPFMTQDAMGRRSQFVDMAAVAYRLKWFIEDDIKEIQCFNGFNRVL